MRPSDCFFKIRVVLLPRASPSRLSLRTRRCLDRNLCIARNLIRSLDRALSLVPLFVGLYFMAFEDLPRCRGQMAACTGRLLVRSSAFFSTPEVMPWEKQSSRVVPRLNVFSLRSPPERLDNSTLPVILISAPICHRPPTLLPSLA